MNEAEYWRKIAIELIWHYEDKEKWKEMYNHYDKVENGDVE